jgi:hypothetical protein
MKMLWKLSSKNHPRVEIGEKAGKIRGTIGKKGRAR